jgi:hypothetical protein
MLDMGIGPEEKDKNGKGIRKSGACLEGIRNSCL